MLIVAWPIAMDEGAAAGLIYALFVGGFGFLGIIITLLLSGPYYRSLKYEILEDEVIVRAGIITKSVKHVPYRTVTNLTIKRGILDRLFGLGTLNIQTAGMSANTNTAEESLVGLINVQEVYELVAAELRRFRGGMSPTQADTDPMDAQVPAAVNTGSLEAVVSELQAIRQLLEKK
jgi:putative membrane protein